MADPDKNLLWKVLDKKIKIAKYNYLSAGKFPNKSIHSFEV